MLKKSSYDDLGGGEVLCRQSVQDAEWEEYKESLVSVLSRE